MRTPETQAGWEQQCFGCSQAESRAGINRLAEAPSHGGAANMALASILSDAQALIEAGRTDTARQYLNRVKDALFHAAPIELWRFDPENVNTEADCMHRIAAAARAKGIDIYARAGR